MNAARAPITRREKGRKKLPEITISNENRQLLFVDLQIFVSSNNNENIPEKFGNISPSPPAQWKTRTPTLSQ